MSLAGVLLNQLISLVRFVSSLCYRLINCIRYGRNSQRIGELPFIMPADQRREFVGSSAYSNNGIQNSNTQDSWNSWDDKAATTEQKIADYRRQQLEKQKAAQIKEKDEEIDLFKELQPTVKEAKKYIIHDPNAQKSQQNVRKDLFSVQDVPTYGQTNELVDLDLDGVNEWEAEDQGVNELLAADKRSLLEEKRRQRQIEHEKRLANKRGKGA